MPADLSRPRRLAAGLAQRPYLLLTITTFGWASNAVAGKLAVGHVSPMAIVTLRWLIVVAVLAAMSGFVARADLRVLARRWPYLLAMGGLGFTVFNALFYWAASYTTAINLGVVQGVTPAAVLVVAFLVHRTPVRGRQVLGIAATLVGVAATASHGDLQSLRDLALNVGDLGMLLASVLYAGYTVGLRDRPPVAPLAFFAGLAVAAFVTSLPLLGWEVASGRLMWPSGAGWLLIVFIALVPSLVCQLLYMRAVQLIGPARAGLFMNLVPVLAPILAVAILGETFAPYHAVALALVLGGIWLAERRG